jgi:REP element-mobilizing transposase RayT
MPRALRIEYPGAVYHVMNRGNQRRDIFRDDTDRRRFLATLWEACAKTGWQVHAYCLMRNHFHLVCETPSANLVAGMKWLLGVYTKRFNIRHQTCGHLFAGRYQALVVDGSGNGYLRTVCDYVHLNPVRARRLRRDAPLTAFVWSRYADYLRPPAQRPGWLRTDRLLGETGRSPGQPRRSAGVGAAVGGTPPAGNRSGRRATAPRRVSGG